MKQMVEFNMTAGGGTHRIAFLPNGYVVVEKPDNRVNTASGPKVLKECTVHAQGSQHDLAHSYDDACDMFDAAEDAPEPEEVIPAKDGPAVTGAIGAETKTE